MAYPAVISPPPQSTGMTELFPGPEGWQFAKCGFHAAGFLEAFKYLRLLFLELAFLTLRDRGYDDDTLRQFQGLHDRPSDSQETGSDISGALILPFFRVRLRVSYVFSAWLSKKAGPGKKSTNNMCPISYSCTNLEAFSF